MGITGLIPFLESVSTRIDIRKIQGSSVAVDSYCWLHKGVFACAEKLARGEKTDIYVNYCLKYIDMLTSHNIKVIMVFDGRHLPAKAITESRRRVARQESKKLAKEYLRNNEIEKARSHMRRAIDVTHEMALQLIQVCRERRVDCIVAPYEADAQMAWLNKAGLAEYIITEDSDLTLFGAEKILFKLDLNGSALLVEKSKLPEAMGCKPEKYTFDKFRRMCILSGCDYLDSLPGIGLKKACKFMLLTEEDDMTKALKKLPSYLKMKQLEVSEEYIEQFLKAEATFRHMFVYNPLLRQMERLCNLEEFHTEEKWCSNAGTLMEDHQLAYQLALGNVNPFTLKQLDNWQPGKEGWSNVSKSKINKTHKSIWNNQIGEKSIEREVTTDKNGRSIATLFKKIEYKNMTEIEIKETQAQERLKLEEVDVFTMYREPIGNKGIKRKRSQSTESSDDENNEQKNNDIVKDNSKATPVKSLNPFAIYNSCKDKIQICANNSLLKNLSPGKDTAKIDVKSRFFSQNIKEVSKMPFAARDLTGELTKIEEKSIKCMEIQTTLYTETSPQNNENDKLIKNEDITENSSEIELELCLPSAEFNKEDIIMVSDNEEADCNEKSIQFSSQKSTSSNSSVASGTRRLGLPKPKKSTGISTKKLTAIIDSKQSTLSMFGFQKRPTMKKI